MNPALRIIALAGSVLAVVAALCGCGSSPSSTGPTVTSGYETMLLGTNSVSSNPTYTLVATGLISGRGTFSGIGNGKNSSLAKLPHGTFVVTHLQSKAKVISESDNPTTCAAKFEQMSPYTISKGTGKYKGISGSGTALVVSEATLPKLKNGKCNLSPNATPVTGTTHTGIRARGPIRLPA